MVTINQKKLLKTEQKIRSGKHIDFLFKNKNDDTVFLVEVMNIHLGQTLRDSEVEVQNFINQKLQRKNLEKGFDENRSFFYLFPIVWTTIENLEILIKYSNDGLGVSNTLPLFCHQSFTNNIDDQVIHKFGPVKTILEK